MSDEVVALTYKQLAVENFQMKDILGKQEVMAKSMSDVFLNLQKTKLTDEQQQIFDDYAKGYADLVGNGTVVINMDPTDLSLAPVEGYFDKETT